MPDLCSASKAIKEKQETGQPILVAVDEILAAVTACVSSSATGEAPTKAIAALKAALGAN